MKKLVLCIMLLVMIVSCSENKKKFIIASSNNPEQILMGEITKLLIEGSTDYEVDVKILNGITLHIQALLANEVNMAYLYTHEMGTFDKIPEYKGNYFSNFNSTWTFAVLTNSKLTKIEEVSGKTLAIDSLFIARKDCLELFTNLYKVNPIVQVVDDHALKYIALDSGKAEVAEVYTTDGQLSLGKYKFLPTPEFMPYNYPVPYFNEEPDPLIVSNIDYLASKLDSKEMQKLNYKVIQGNLEKNIAYEYYQTIK